MANELTIETSLSFIKGLANVDFEKKASITVAGTRYTKMVQEVAITEEALELGDMSNPGYILIVNRDGANFISIRPGTGENDMVTVPSGGVALFQFASTAPFVIADTAVVEIEYLLIEL